MQTIQCSSHLGVEIHMIAIMCLANLSLTRQLISTQTTKGHEYLSPNYKVIHLIFNLSKTILDLWIEGWKLGQGLEYKNENTSLLRVVVLCIYHIQQTIIIPYINFEDKNDGKLQLTIQHQNCSRWVWNVPLICNGSRKDFINWINFDKKKNNE
jgi:hypothetical protein